MMQILKNNIHVNIVDLVDAIKAKKRVKTFKTESSLSKYTRATEKFFPKERAKEDDFLKQFLIVVG
jgi:hypothetical protein